MFRFCYARYHTRQEAESQLEDMFANGEVCEAEQPIIQRRTVYNHAAGEDRTYYDIVLPG